MKSVFMKSVYKIKLHISESINVYEISPSTMPNTTGAHSAVARILGDLDHNAKVIVVILLATNVVINLVFKLLVLQLSRKIGSIRHHPMNGIILVDEFEKLVGCLSCTAWTMCLLFGIKPAESFGFETCILMAYSADFGFNASLFGGLAIAILRLLYLKV